MKKKLVFIGNSIVNGFPWKRSQCFVSLVRESTGYDVINKGINGDTTGNIMRRFGKDVIGNNPDQVFILSGTNDFIYDNLSPAQVYMNIAAMAETAADNGIPPVLLTPLPVDAEMASRLWMAGSGTDYSEVNRQLEELSRIIRNGELEFIDLNREYRKCGLYHDGVHPTPEGHAFIAQVILRRINQDITVL
ncbi:MAG: GDSL-type esterase/lipase family protein [Firmicutes bacterium]|nr:GDSL-type esterase/lipase family protein [Bacillota bacterium]